MATASTIRIVVIGGVFLLAAALLPACGDDDGDSSGPDTGGGTVTVGLQEFAVSADPSSVPAGSVTFDVTNNGPDDVHELVVISTDLDPIDLPTDENGVVLEDGEGMEVVDEIEDIAVGDSQTLTVDLEAGSYALICNILQEEPDGTLEAHYAEGMRIGFTVE